MSYSGTYAQRTQRFRILNDEIRNKIRRRIRHATLAVFGLGQTGKKTLACRFGAMNKGPFEEEVQIRNYYMAYVDLDTRHTNATGVVYLKTYVVPPPIEQPEGEDPLYFKDLLNLSAMVFICSVTERATFDGIVERIHELRRDIYQARMPYFLIVGNKMDVNRSIYPRHFAFSYGLITTQCHFDKNYEECSAKQNMNMDIILEEILQQIIAEQP